MNHQWRWYPRHKRRVWPEKCTGAKDGIGNAQGCVGSTDWCGKAMGRRTEDRSSVAGRRRARRVNGGVGSKTRRVPWAVGRNVDVRRGGSTDRLSSTNLELRCAPSKVNTGPGETSGA